MTVEYIGYDTASTTTGSSLAIPLPAGRAIGDVAFIMAYLLATAATAIATPTGWTLVATETQAAGQERAVLLKRKLDGSEGATVTVSWTATTLAGFTGTATAFRGVDTVNGTYDVTVATGHPTGHAFTIPYGATTQQNSRVLVFAMNDSGFPLSPGQTSTTPSFYDQSSEFRLGHAFSAGLNRGSPYLYFIDQTLPGSGSLTLDSGQTFFSYNLMYFTLSLRAADISGQPGADSLFGLTSQAPARSQGVLMDPEDLADWSPKVSVQVASPNPSDGAYWDLSFWDVDGWGDGYQWVDISDRLRGAHWERGAPQSGQRPETGTMTLTLENDDGAASPWAVDGAFAVGGETWLLSGLLVRIGATVHHDGIYEHLPYFTGTVESYDEGTSGDVDAWVTLTCTETVAQLPQSNDVALGAPVGVGDTLAQRVARLVAAADWPFGYTASGGIAGGTLQSTVMAQDKLTELFLTVDSLYARAVAGSGGRLVVTDQNPTSGTAALAFSNDPTGPEFPIPSDGIKPYASSDRLLNRAVVARSGGTQVQYDDTVSQSRFNGTFASGYGFPRSDLICSTDAMALAVATAAVTDHAYDDLGIGSIQVNVDNDPVNLYRVLCQYAALGVEYRQPLTVRWVHPSGKELSINLRVDGVAFDLIALDPNVRMGWVATIATSKDATA